MKISPEEIPAAKHSRYSLDNSIFVQRIKDNFRRPGVWFTLFILILITLLHYSEVFKYPPSFISWFSDFGLDRHAFERTLYLAPIVWAGFMFGWRGAFITSLISLGCMLPRAIFVSDHPTDAILETSIVFIIGNVLAISFASLRKEREYRKQLEISQKEHQKTAATSRKRFSLTSAC